MNTQTATAVATQPNKFSRYRSVRKAGVPADSAVPPVPAEDSTSINRAPSRYRRPTQPSAPNAPPLPSLTESQPSTDTQSSPAQNRSPPAQRYRQRPQEGDNNVVGGPVQPVPAAAPSRYHQRELSRAKTVTRPDTATSQRYDAAREEARMILEGEYDRLQKLKEVQKRNERKLKAAQEAQAAQEKAAREAQAAQEAKAAREAKAAQEAKEAEQRRLALLEEIRAPDSSHAAARHNLGNFVDAPKAQVVRQPTRKQNRFITAPQNMIRDQAPKAAVREDHIPKSALQVNASYDAPVSAVNAGERRVQVKIMGAKHAITLPVTPNTTVKDLLNSASVVMSEPIDPRTSVLVESFAQFGLERPLRRYEHIRDIMNSWDHDSQNELVIMSESDCVATGLEKKEAPTTQPGDIELQMMLSSKPGKWDRRWIILRSDGQVTVSKRENDGEGANICHLSDFDVYTPTRKEEKRLRPPKKICFAVKSQQKSSMFLEGTNYVHFFATGERQIADRWYSAVQSWRSWYLANVLGEAATPVQAKESGSKQDARPGTANSQDSVPYQLGSFQPLLNLNFDDMKFEDSLTNPAPASGGRGHRTQPSKHSLDLGAGRRSMDQRGSLDIDRSGTQRRGSRPTRVPPSSYPGKLLNDARNRVDLGLDSDEQAFTGGGLLARSGSKRGQNSNAVIDGDENAFTGGGLLARSASRRGQGGNGAGQDTSGGKGKPLLDLSENSEFTDGSLLKQLHAWTALQGDNEPKVDRQKRVEADVKVGEGY